MVLWRFRQSFLFLISFSFVSSGRATAAFCGLLSFDRFMQKAIGCHEIELFFANHLGYGGLCFIKILKMLAPTDAAPKRESIFLGVLLRCRVRNVQWTVLATAILHNFRSFSMVSIAHPKSSTGAVKNSNRATPLTFPINKLITVTVFAFG